MPKAKKPETDETTETTQDETVTTDAPQGVETASTAAVILEFDTDNEGFQIRSKAIVEELNRLGVKADIAFVDETKRTSRLVVPFKALV